MQLILFNACQLRKLLCIKRFNGALKLYQQFFLKQFVRMKVLQLLYNMSTEILLTLDIIFIKSWIGQIVAK